MRGGLPFSVELPKYKQEVIEAIEEAKQISKDPLEAKNRDHALSGNYKGYQECHIQPNWLLTQTSHIKNGICSLKNQYYRS